MNILKIFKEVAMASFVSLSWHLPKGTGENHKKISEESESALTLESQTSR
jgi:hypothetical protein